MNTILNKKILLGLIPIFAAFAFAFPARAATLTLDVVFTPNPIFTQANFLPGDTATGTARVYNLGPEPQTVIAEAAHVLDPDNLSSQLHLLITKASGGAELYNGSFKTFLTGGEMTLSALTGGSDETYSFVVAFNNINDNSYQGKTIGFNLCVGFQGGQTHCGDTVAGGEGDIDNNDGNSNSSGGQTNPGPGGTGGGGGGTPNLTISNEQAIAIDPDTGNAVITWNTNIYSTSQVIYGPATTSPYTLNLNALPNFGYPMGTIETTTKILNHSVTLTGLIPGETYKYRVVSRASPPTISFEREFTVPGAVAFANNGESGDLENFQTINNIAAAPQKQLAINGKKIIVSGENYSGDINSIGSIENINSEDNAVFQEKISEKTPGNLGNLASVLFALNQGWGILKYILIFLFLAGIVWVLFFKKKNVA